MQATYKRIYKSRLASLILIATGYGWAGGHYIPSNSPFVAYLFQLVVIGFLIIFGVNYFSCPDREKMKSNWAVRGLTIFSILSLLANIFNVIHGAYSTNLSSYGSHNSLADLVPISIIIIGTVMWLVTLLPKFNPS